MPTFVFFKSKVKIDELRGADPTVLEAKIKQHAGASGEEDEDVGVPGHVSISWYFIFAPFDTVVALEGAGGYSHWS